MHGWAARSGLAAVALPDIERGPEEARRNAWAWDHWNKADPTDHPEARPLGEDEVLAQVRALASLCSDADLLLSTSIRFHGLLAQRASGIPWLTFSFNPYAFWRPVDSEELAALRDGSRGYYQRALLAARQALGRAGPARPAAGVVARLALRAARAAGEQHGLQPSRHGAAAAAPERRPDGVLVVRGPGVGAVAARPRPRGLLRAPADRALLQQPAARGRRGRSSRATSRLRRSSGCRCSSSAAGPVSRRSCCPPGRIRAQVLFADFLPQDWLFARAACSIQHGGVGTIARALRAGCPMLVEPFGNDQLYNASRVSLLGAGAAVQPFASTAEGLARVLSGQVLTASARERAAALGARIGAERGLDHACRLIEAFLARPDARGPVRGCTGACRRSPRSPRRRPRPRLRPRRPPRSAGDPPDRAPELARRRGPRRRRRLAALVAGAEPRLGAAPLDGRARTAS